jgi:hypothetical protein
MKSQTKYKLHRRRKEAPIDAVIPFTLFSSFFINASRSEKGDYALEFILPIAILFLAALPVYADAFREARLHEVSGCGGRPHYRLYGFRG